jgi:hypothetical protein
VNLLAGKVWLAGNQDNPSRPEYLVDECHAAFVLAVDELGAFVRAKHMIKEQTND